MANVKYINGYNIESNEKFFIDANIWLYMYCPIGDYNTKVVEKYSSFFDKIISSGNEIYICSSLISEILNRYMRIEFQLAKEENGIEDYKKDFRNNVNYKESIECIEKIIKEKIIDKCIQINDQFENFDYDSKYLNNGLDFNDALYCHLAVENGLKIVTHDRDFKKTKLPVEVITY